MITNQRQYKITLAQVERFEKALQNLATSEEAQTMHPVKLKLYEDSLQSQLGDLREELAAYDRLQEGKQTSLPIDSLDGLAIGLIQARIASGWTQKQLAERLGIKEQQVQRYEATQYRAASLERLREVMIALNVTVQGQLVSSSA